MQQGRLRAHVVSLSSVALMSLSACGGGGGGATGGGVVPAVVTAAVPTVPAAAASGGTNIATQLKSGVWFGVVPAGSTSQSGVAVSLEMPATPAAANDLSGTFSFQLGNASQPLAVTRAVMRAAPATPVRAYQLPVQPDTSALRAGSRAPSAEQRTAFAERRAEALSVGMQRNFWIYRGAITAQGVMAQVAVPFKLAALSAHGAIWLDQTAGRPTAALAPATADRIAANFERVWALVDGTFGASSYGGGTPAGSFQHAACDASGASLSNVATTFPVADPGVMSVLIVDQTNLGDGFAGYNATADWVPQALANCMVPGGTIKSNELPNVVVGWMNGSSGFDELAVTNLETMVHEYAEIATWIQHAVVRNGNEEPSFMLDGLAQVAQDLIRGKPTFRTVSVAATYLAAPQNYALTSFSGTDGGTYSTACGGCYGEAYLFMRYLVDRFGTSILATIVQSAQTGLANVGHATGLSPQQLVEDFATALAVSGTGMASAPYRYTTLPLRGGFVDADGQAWSGATLTPHPAVVLSAAAPAQNVAVYPGALVFFGLGPLGAAGNAVKVSDVGQNRSLWLGLSAQ